MSFKFAGSIGFKEAVRHAKPILLEPIMKVEVLCPDANLGDIIGDLNSRRASIEALEAQPGGMQSIRTRACRWRRCSATPPRYVHCRRDAAPSPWNRHTINRCRVSISEEVLGRKY